MDEKGVGDQGNRQEGLQEIDDGLAAEVVANLQDGGGSLGDEVGQQCQGIESKERGGGYIFGDVPGCQGRKQDEQEVGHHRGEGFRQCGSFQHRGGMFLLLLC